MISARNSSRLPCGCQRQPRPPIPLYLVETMLNTALALIVAYAETFPPESPVFARLLALGEAIENLRPYLRGFPVIDEAASCRN